MAVKNYTEAPIARSLLLTLLKEYQRPNDKISELLKSQDLLPLRRGLYIPGPKMDLPTPEPFLIANHLRGPSYVSLESALSYWNMIPERAYEISSVTLKTPKRYTTPVGRFSYQHVNAPYYAYGLKSIEHSPRQRMLVASPEKALCDKIVLTTGVNLRSIKQTEAFLMEDLRIDGEVLHSLDIELMGLWLDHAPKQGSISMLIKTLQTL